MNTLGLRAAVACALACCGAAAVHASSHAGQDLVAPQSWVYEALAALSAEQGAVSFADAAPLSVWQVKALLDAVDYDSLSLTGKNMYDRVVSFLCEQNWSAEFSVFSLGVDPEVSLEAQAKTDEQVRWQYSRFDRKPLVALPIRLQAQDFATVQMTVPLAENKNAMERHANYTNVPTALDDFDINFTHDAYMNAGFTFSGDSGFSVRISQMPSDVGRSLMGSITWSRYMTDYTMVSMEFFSPSFRFTTAVSQLNTDRYFYTHRMDVRPFRRLSLSVMEGTLVAHGFELRFLNPFAIFHNFSAWHDYEPSKSFSDKYVTSYLSIRADVAVSRFLRLYAYFAMDQIQLPSEQSDTDVTPNGLGIQGGAECFVPVGGGYLHGWLEGYYAMPYLYIKIDPNWSRLRTYQETINGSLNFYEWAGSPLGPDTAAGSLSVAYEVPGRWQAGLSYRLVARGEYANTKIFTDVGWGGRVLEPKSERDSDGQIKDWVYPHKGDTTKRSYVAPHGIVEWENRVTLSAQWIPQGVQGISVMVQPSLAFVSNCGNVAGNDRVSFECALSSTMNLRSFVRSVSGR